MSGNTGKCDKTKENKCKIKNLKGYEDVEENNPDALYEALTGRPISVAVDAGIWSFYGGGVLNESQCGDDLNHGVLLIGWNSGESQGTKASWVVKNSWSTSWGV